MAKGLVLKLGANTAEFEKGMSRARDVVVYRSAEMISAVSKASGPLQVALTGMAGQGMLGPVAMRAAQFLVTYKAALLGASAAAAVMVAAVELATEAVERMTHIGTAAKAAGVGSDFFQAWTKAAERAGIATKEAEQALVNARANLSTKVDKYGAVQGNDIYDLMGEAAIGRGVGQKAYGDLIASRDTESRIRAVTEAIRAYNEAVRAGGDRSLNALGDKLAELTFGSSKFAESIRQAKDGMDGLIAAGQASGTIFSAELVARAKELDERLKVVKSELKDQMIPTMQTLGALGLEVKEGWIKVLETIALANAAITTMITGVQKLASYVPTLGDGFQKIADLAKSFNLIGTEHERHMTILRAAQKSPSFAGGPKDPMSLAYGASLLDPNRIVWGKPGDGSVAPAQPPARPAPSVLNNPTPTPTSTKSAATDEGMDQVDRYNSRLQRSIDLINAEIGALGKSKIEKQIAIELAGAEAAARERGAPLTEKEIRLTTELATKKAELIKTLEAYKKKQEDINSVGQFFGSNLVDAFDGLITGGQKLEDVLNNIVKALIKAALQAALLGQGPLAGILGMSGSDGNMGGAIGAVINGFRASGGPVQAGKTYLVGENGPELARFGRNGSIVPNGLVAGGGGRGGGSGVMVKIENHGAQVEPKDGGRGADGMQMLALVVRQVMADDVTNNGPLAKLFQNQYKLRRNAGRYA